MSSVNKKIINRRVSCSYGACPSNANHDPDLKFIPFAKPCKMYFHQLALRLIGRDIHPNKIHHPMDCEQCSKCLFWIFLSKRASGRLTELHDITKKTYICAKHFVSKSGPTDENPDPLPAELPPYDLASLRKSFEETMQQDREIQKLKHKKLESTDTRDADLFVAENNSNKEMPIKILCIRSLQRLQEDEGTQTESRLAARRQPNPKITSLLGKRHQFVQTDFDQNTADCAWEEKSQETQTDPSQSAPILTNALNGITESKPEMSYVESGWACECKNGVFSYYLMGTWKNEMDESEKTVVNVKVTQTESLHCRVFILDNLLPSSEELGRQAAQVDDYDKLHMLLTTLKSVVVCRGISDKKCLVVFKNIGHSKQGRFCTRTDTVRSVSCKMVTEGVRCVECIKYLFTLRNCVRTKKRKFGNKHFSCKEELTRKNVRKTTLRNLTNRVKVLQNKNRILNSTVRKTHEQLLSDITYEGGTKDSGDCDRHKLFLIEQYKVMKRKSGKGYGWHPLVVKWCLDMKKKSVAVYKMLRTSGFLVLPSLKTLNKYEVNDVENLENPETLVSMLEPVVELKEL